MKKIISGRMYDTHTARKVAEWENMSNVDMHWCSEALFQKRNGEYFLHGEGGPMSRYARSTGDGWTWGEAITPLTYDAAREWMEGHADADEYEAEFGDVPEGDEEDVVVSMRVSPKAKAFLDRMASKSGRTRSDLLTEALLDLGDKLYG